jgi:cysteine-rich repeat protein
MKTLSRSFVSSLFLSIALGVSGCGQDGNDLPECGNGLTEVGEQCDDGNTVDGDGCDSNCEEEDECGDGVIDANLGENCDDGNTQNNDGCSSACRIEGPSQAEQIDDYIEGLGTLNLPAPQAEAPEGAPVDTSYGPYQCSTQNFRQVKVIDSFKLQGGAIQEQIFPGMLLNGTALAAGNFTEVVVDKKPLTLSHDVGQLPIATIEMSNPTIGSFSQARTDLLVNQLGTQTFAAQELLLKDETTTNQDELSLSLGFDVSAGIATETDVAGQFDFNNTTTQSRFLVRIVNELYTMKIDPVTFASDFFADNVTLGTIQSLFQSGAPPVYVDTVTYGREVYVSVETTFSEREVALALQAAVSNDAAQFDATLDFGLTARQVLDQTDITAIVVGPLPGDQNDIGLLSGAARPEALSRLKTREASLSETSIGQPISFTVRYLPSIFGSANSVVDASYPRETCSRRPVSFDVEVDRMNVTAIGDGNTPDAEVRGTIKLISGQNSLNIFNRAVGSEFVFTQGTFNGPGGAFKSGTLADVDTTFNVGETITIEFSLEEDDNAGVFEGAQGDGIDNNVDDFGFVTRTIPVEDLYANGGQVKVSVGSVAGIGFDLFINFTPQLPLVP